MQKGNIKIYTTKENFLKLGFCQQYYFAEKGSNQPDKKN